jgi:hypothetical protein
MNCPACKNILITIEFDDFEIDRCFECSGIWLDSGELENLFEKSGLNIAGLDFLQFTACREKDRKCPECGTKMNKLITGKNNIVVDQCTAHGIWFDAGELERLLISTPESNAATLVSILKNMLSGEH